MEQNRTTNIRDLNIIENRIKKLINLKEELYSKILNKITIPSGIYKPKELIGCYEYVGPMEFKKASKYFDKTLTRIDKYIETIKLADNPDMAQITSLTELDAAEDDEHKFLSLTDSPQPVASKSFSNLSTTFKIPVVNDGGDIIQSSKPFSNLSTIFEIPATNNEGDIIQSSEPFNLFTNSEVHMSNGESNVIQSAMPFKVAIDSGIFMTNSDNQQIFDRSGKKIKNVSKCRNQVYEIKRDADGNIIAVRISPDGVVPENWIRVFAKSGVYILCGKEGKFIIEDGSMNIYDASGNVIGKAEQGEYKMSDVMYNEDSSIAAMRISEADANPDQWIKAGDGNAVARVEFVGQVGKYTFTGEYIDIFDESGNLIGRLPSGEYAVYGTKVDGNGNVIAIRISQDGEPERWLNIYKDNKYIGNYSSLETVQECRTNSDKMHLNMFGNGSFVVGGVLGILAVSAGISMIVKNKKNEKTSELTEGSYNVYGTKKDSSGNITDAKISPNGEEECWVHVYDNI